MTQDSTFDFKRVGTVALGHWVHDSYSAFLAPMLIIFKETVLVNEMVEWATPVFRVRATTSGRCSL